MITKAEENRSIVEQYLTAIDADLDKLTEEYDIEARELEERQRRAGKQSARLNELKRKRESMKENAEMDEGVKKAKFLFNELKSTSLITQEAKCILLTHGKCILLYHGKCFPL